MQNSIGDKERILHAIDAILLIKEFTNTITLEEFENNKLISSATINQFSIIGEACNHISKSVKLSNSTIDWAKVVGLRNLMVHEYFGIDLSIIWQIIVNDLDKLNKDLIDIKNKLTN